MKRKTDEVLRRRQPTVVSQQAAKKLARQTSNESGGRCQRLPDHVPDAQLASTSLTESSSGTVSIKISCPALETSCAGTVTLRTLNAVIASVGSSAKAKATVLTLATGSFTVPGGKVKTITLHLSAKARALLAKSHVLHVRVTIAAHDTAGAKHTTQVTVTIRAPKAKHGKG